MKNKQLEKQQRVLKRLIDERYKPSFWYTLKENIMIFSFPFILLIFVLGIIYLLYLSIKNPLSLLILCSSIIIIIYLILRSLKC